MAESAVGDPLDHFDVGSLLHEVVAVVNAAHDKASHRAGEYWGICVLAERVLMLVEAAGHHPNEDTYDVASNAIGGALALIGQYNDDTVDDQLLYAVESLLSVAKKKLDRDWFVLEQSAVEVQHG